MEISNKRCIQILKLLLKNKECMTGDNLAVSIGVSSRTIRNDMKDLNRALEDHGASVVSEIGQGYYLKIEDQEKFLTFQNEMEEHKREKDFKNIIPSEPEDRVKYIISKLLLSTLNGRKEKIEFFDLEEELFISTSTLKKDFRNIDKVLKPYDLKTSITKKDGVKIVGDEAKIRYCISEYIFNSKGYFGIEENQFYQSIFKEQEIEKLREILLDVISVYNLRLTDLAFKNVLIHSLIMLKRFARQKSVTYEENDIKAFEKKVEFECAQEIIKRIQKEFEVDLGNEVYYLTQHLISSQRFLIDDPKEDYEYKNEIEKILIKIKEETNIDLSDDKQLINGLAMHLSAALQRMRFDMNIRNEFLDSIKNMYPLAFELAVIAGEIIEENFQFRTQENEIGFLAMHFGAALERKGLNEKKPRKKAIIVCYAGVATAMLIKEKIEQNFGHKIEVIKTCSQQEVSQELIDQVDLVLTTAELSEFKSDKIKKINLFLDETDIQFIGNILKEDQKGEIDYRKIFRKELFFYDVEFKNKEEILEHMTREMQIRGLISKEGSKSVFKREEMSTTELGNMVAIPHAMSNDSEEAVVSVMILKKPILWENEKVQVVLLLNVPKSQYNMWEVVFKRLYQYLIGDQGVTKLIKDKDYDDFIRHLERNE